MFEDSLVPDSCNHHQLYDTQGQVRSPAVAMCSSQVSEEETTLVGDVGTTWGVTPRLAPRPRGALPPPRRRSVSPRDAPEPSQPPLNNQDPQGNTQTLQKNKLGSSSCRCLRRSCPLQSSSLHHGHPWDFLHGFGPVCHPEQREEPPGDGESVQVTVMSWLAEVSLPNSALLNPHQLCSAPSGAAAPQQPRRR